VVHDSQATDDLLNENDEGQELYADSAYTGETQEETIALCKMINKVCEKRYRNNPLTEEQKNKNTEKSRTRARVELVFGFMEQSMNGLKLTRAIANRQSKSIGIVRATGIIGLINLTYNLFRYEQVIRLNISHK
jgi:IS5 family transposase